MKPTTRALVALALVASFTLGHEVHRREWIPLALRQRLLGLGESREKDLPAGWSMARSESRHPGPLESPEAVESLGYLAGYKRATGRESVTIHDRASTRAGLNFYVSGHAPEAILMDMEGHVLHRWRHDFRAQWPDAEPLPVFGTEGQTYWRRAHVFDNGDLLAIYDGFGLVKLDKNSRVLWAKSGGYHHDLHVTPDGLIYVLDRDIHVLARWNEQVPVVEDFVTILSPTGDVRRRVSILESLEHSRYAPVLVRVPRRADMLHTNTLQVLDGTLGKRSRTFQAGNVLVSLWGTNTVAILDLATERVVWSLSDFWVRQHQPELLPNLRLLAFDNQGNGGRSRVTEMDLLTQEIVWEYAGMPEEPLDSHLLGSCQRLRNGNTLITESTNGRAIEVTPDGRVVWEFRSPHRAGEHGELVANLFEVIRLAPDFPVGWLAIS